MCEPEFALESFRLHIESNFQARTPLAPSDLRPSFVLACFFAKAPCEGLEMLGCGVRENLGLFISVQTCLP